MAAFDLMRKSGEKKSGKYELEFFHIEWNESDIKAVLQQYVKDGQVEQAALPGPVQATLHECAPQWIYQNNREQVVLCTTKIILDTKGYS